MDAKERTLQSIGRGAYSEIQRLVVALECDYDRLGDLADMGPDDMTEEDRKEFSTLCKQAGECTSREDACMQIEEDPLSVEVRSAWIAPGAPMEPAEFCILISTGGPAVRIRGSLDWHCAPRRAWLEVQDWDRPWTEYIGEPDEVSQDTLLAYARVFYYGE